tara:strand:+ start:998 stop:1225 length:228 start_codon:yes stop_codon:yes gene_type:complete
MFYASLLFCWISLNGPQCLVAEDSLGPYKEIAQCQERIEDMSERILEEMPFAEVRGSKCDRGGDSGVYKGFSEFT